MTVILTIFQSANLIALGMCLDGTAQEAIKTLLLLVSQLAEMGFELEVKLVMTELPLRIS